MIRNAAPLTARLIAFGAVVSLGVSLAQDARAQLFDTSIPQNEVCVLDQANQPPRRILEPRLLVAWLLTSDPITDRALDANADGDTLFSEKQVALAEEGYCSGTSSPRCTPADAAAQSRLHATLVRFVETEGGSEYTFERLRRPDPVSRAAHPVLAAALEDPDRAIQIGEVLMRDPRFVQIVCVDPSPPTVAEAPPEEGERWTIDTEEGGFRLTGRIDDLSKGRDRIREVAPAQFSIARDLLSQQTSFQVNAVAGYDFEVARGDNVRFGMIPFGLVQRFFEGTITSIDNLGAGLQFAARIRAADLGSSEIAVTPLFETDSDLDSKIGSLKFRWSPTLPPDAAVPLGFFEQYGPVVATFGLDALSEVGLVLDPGTDPNLAIQDDFLRIGGRVRFSVRGAEDTLLEQFEIDVANRYFYDLIGTIENINLFETSVAYNFPGVENYRFSFSYSTGLSEQTLDEIDLWQTQLGVRF
jgi:hypothetical protein